QPFARAARERDAAACVEGQELAHGPPWAWAILDFYPRVGESTSWQPAPEVSLRRTARVGIGGRPRAARTRARRRAGRDASKGRSRPAGEAGRRERPPVPPRGLGLGGPQR